MRTRVDRLFLRFRRDGDPRLLASVFDLTAAELWRVATHLCRDRHDAEDAVQGAFLAAIESRESWDAERPLLPWLVGLLVNRVRELRRRRERVLDATRVATPRAADPHAAAAEREFGVVFATALGGVTEPFRSVVEQHLVRGMKAGDIANELGVPAATVRTRLHRGLEQLRQRLPAGVVAGGLVPVRLPAESFASMRQVVLQHVPGGGAVAGAGPAVFAAAGVLTMQKLLFSVVVVCVALGVWWALDAPAQRGEPNRTPPAPVVAVSDATSPPPAPAAAITRVAVPPPIVSDAGAAGAGELSVLVRHAATHAPLAGVTVVAMQERPAAPAAVGPEAATSSADRDAAPSRADGKTDASGRVVLHLAAGPARVLVFPGVPEPSFVTVQACTTTEHVHDVEPAFTADVLVRDHGGAPVADATILVQDDMGQDLREVGRTGADGHWRDARTEPQLLVRAAHRGFAASAMERVSGTSATTVLELGPEAATMQGTVFDEVGAAVPDAVVVFAAVAESARSSVPITLRTDARGRYRCEWLAPGAYELLVSQQRAEHDRRVQTFRGDAGPGEGPATDLRFTSAAAATVQLRRHDGGPAANHSFQLVRKRGEIPVAFAPWCYFMGKTDSTGAGAIEGLMPGRYLFSASHYNAGVEREVELVAGETLHLDHTFAELCSLQIEVVDERGQPRAGVGVQVAVGDNENEQKRCTTDASGAVCFDNVERRDYEVALFATAKGLPQSKHTVSPGGVVRLVMPVDVARGKVAGRVVSRHGELPKALSLSLYHDVANNPFRPESAAVVLDAASGRFVCDDLPAGRYWFSAMTTEPFRNLARRDVEVTAGAVLDLGTIELGSGVVRIEVRTPGGPGEVHASVAFGDDIYSPGPRPRAPQNPIELKHLAAGSYRVLVWGEQVLPRFVDVVVAIDAVSSLVVDAERGVRTEVRLPGSIGTMHVHMPDGSVLHEMVLESKSWVRGLQPGSYRVDYVAFGGGRFGAGFTVGAGGIPPIELDPAPR